MIFEYFVFSTVYIQNLFSGVHPYALTSQTKGRPRSGLKVGHSLVDV